MKRLILTGAVLAAFCSSAMAQTIYEASRMTEEDVNGTARYVSMGGAMNALGGDISVMRTNPAGIGIFRSNDLSLSFSYLSTKTGDMAKAKGGMSFDNIGLVYANRISNDGALRFVNFGFNYHKRRNFNNRTVSSRGGANFNTSQTFQFANMAMGGTDGYGNSGYDPSQLEASSAYITTNPYVGWLPIMAYNAFLINPVFYPGEGEGGKDLFKGEYQQFMPGSNLDNYYEAEETGWINDYDFNLSFNILDRGYLGFTLTASDVRYTKSSLYKEDFYKGDIYGGGYDIKNYFSTRGSGLGFSLGGIYRVLPSMRLSLSFTTPTIYWLSDYQESSLAYDVDDLEGKRRTGEVMPVDSRGNFIPYEYSYQVVTPWKVNVGVGGTLLNMMAIDAEYEYRNGGKTKLRDTEGVKLVSENESMSKWFKGQHTFKVGAEISPFPMFAIRAGYNYTTSLFGAFDASNPDGNAFKYLSPMAARTDTEFSNTYSRQNISVGLGFRARYVYIDAAYQYSIYKQDFFEFDDLALMPVELTNTRHQVLFTLGCKF